MIYRQCLLVRKTLAWFVSLMVVILLIGFVTNLFQFTPGETDYAGIAVDSGWLAAIFASIIGVTLGNGSRQVARVLWMLPAARWKLALQVIIVDLAATTVAFACAYSVMLLFLFFVGQHFMLGTFSMAEIVMALAMAYATYGWSSVAGILGRRLAYCGIIALPALMIWMTFAQSRDNIGTMLRAPIVANPFAVYNAGLNLNSWGHHRFNLDPTASSLQWLSTIWTTPILVATAVATCGLAVALWQRAEAID